MARALIALGVLLVAAGVLIKLGVPIGRLPGDIVIHRGSSTFYFPLVTCIIVSIVLTVLAAVFRKF